MTKRIEFIVRGRVQGVGFRYFTVRAAQHLNLRGWVRNAADGSVNGEVQGDTAQVQSFIEQISKGATFSRVSEVLQNEVPLSNTEEGFDVR